MAAVGWWGAAGAAAASGERARGRGAATGPARRPPSACSRRITTTTTSGTRCCRHSTTCPMQQVRAGLGWGELHLPLGCGTVPSEMPGPVCHLLTPLLPPQVSPPQPSLPASKAPLPPYTHLPGGENGKALLPPHLQVGGWAGPEMAGMGAHECPRGFRVCPWPRGWRELTCPWVMAGCDTPGCLGCTRYVTGSHGEALETPLDIS